MASGNLGIDSLTTGISSSGMENYIEGLKAEYITTTEELIDDISNIQNIIDNGWQGVAKDNFMSQFEKARNNVKEDLRKEYDNLVARLNELQAQYFEADSNMVSND